MRTPFRWSVRLLILALAVFLLIGGPISEYAVRVIPALSPLSTLAAGLAHRTWYISLAWSLPALFVLLLAFWKGRFFCRWICPLGTIYSLPTKVSLKRRIFPWQLSGYFFWFIFFAALVGLPLILFLDPLSGFTRMGALGHGTASVMAWIPGFIVPLMLLFSFVQPQLWCTQLCPLGYFLGLVKVKKKSKKVVSQTRREFLAGLALGVPIALLFKNVARAKTLPVLPPGATSLDDFAATCIRCYACVNICATEVLVVRKEGGLAELCLPEMDFDRFEGSYCEQYCNDCLQVCPTGALRSLSLDEKQNQKIATASIIRDACLAWADHKECMACDEYCAYNAIEMRTGKDGIPKPVVNPDLCRGCGACRNVCPAVRKGNAIHIEPLYTQKVIIHPKEEEESEAESELYPESY